MLLTCNNKVKICALPKKGFAEPLTSVFSQIQSESKNILFLRDRHEIHSSPSALSSENVSFLFRKRALFAFHELRGAFLYYQKPCTCHIGSKYN